MSVTRIVGFKNIEFQFEHKLLSGWRTYKVLVMKLKKHKMFKIKKDYFLLKYRYNLEI